MTDLTTSPAPPPPTLPPAARFVDPDGGDYTLKFDLHSDALPSGRTARVRPIKGPAERDLTASLQAKGPAQIDHMAQFFLKTIEQIDSVAPSLDVVLELDDADVRALLLRIRCVSLGQSLVQIAWDCTPPIISKEIACGYKRNGATFDLDDADFVALVPSRVLRLGTSGKQASWPPNTLAVQREYLSRRKKNVEGLDLDALFVARKVSLDGKVATSAMLDDLGLADRSALRGALAAWGGPDVRVVVPCKGCGVEMKAPATSLPGFFFPETARE